jgi:hypothetical protein
MILKLGQAVRIDTTAGRGRLHAERSGSKQGFKKATT